MDDVAGKTPLPANARRIPIPAAAMAQWLADIDDIDELKVTLRALALLAEEPRRRSVPPSIPLDDLLEDRFLAIGNNDYNARAGLVAALSRGTLLVAPDRGDNRIFLNDSIAQLHFERTGLSSLSPDDLLDSSAVSSRIQPPAEAITAFRHTNIFALYEEHIGAYGHSMAEQLKAAEEEYPAPWIEHAFALASRHNARSWSYVNSVLQRLVREGLPSEMVVQNEHGKSGNDPEANRSAEFLESYRRRHGRLPWEPPNRNVST